MTMHQWAIALIAFPIGYVLGMVRYALHVRKFIWSMEETIRAAADIVEAANKAPYTPHEQVRWEEDDE